MRLSRPCYDKYHRCPGWAGGGLKFPKKDKCDNGYINTYVKNGSRYKVIWKWRFHRCYKCRVIVFPYNIRWLDPTWLWAEIKWKFRKCAK